MKNNLLYFSHDNDARNHPKMKALRAQYGAAGYGRFWMLNEMISAAPEARLDMSRKINRLAVAQELGMNIEELEQFLAFLSDPEIDLVNIENDLLFTDRTQGEYKSVHAERERKKDRYEASRNSPERNEISPGKNSNSPRRNDTEKRKEEKKEQHTCNIDIETRAHEEQAPCQIACLPALNLEIRERVKTAPFPSSFSDQDYEDFTRRLTDRDLDATFVDYCIKKASEKGSKNPAGLFKLGLMTYDAWIDEHLWKPAPLEKKPYIPYRQPDIPPLEEQDVQKLNIFARQLRARSGIRSPPGLETVTSKT